MGSPLMQLLKQLLLLAQGALPEGVRPLLGIVANLIGNVNLPAADPRLEQIAILTKNFIADMQKLQDITDATQLMRARLVLENRFVNAWDALGLDAA